MKSVADSHLHGSGLKGGGGRGGFLWHPAALLGIPGFHGAQLINTHSNEKEEASGKMHWLVGQR